MYKKLSYISTKNLYSPFLFSVVERLEIFGRQVEPRWEGAETVSEGWTRALGLRTKTHINVLHNKAHT